MIASRKIFDESDRLHSVQESEKIRDETIKGRIIFDGAGDDALRDTAKYIRSMVHMTNGMKHALLRQIESPALHPLHLFAKRKAVRQNDSWGLHRFLSLFLHQAEDSGILGFFHVLVFLKMQCGQGRRNPILFRLTLDAGWAQRYN